MNSMLQRAHGMSGMLTSGSYFGPYSWARMWSIRSVIIGISAAPIPPGICACIPSPCLLTVAFIVPSHGDMLPRNGAI